MIQEQDKSYKIINLDHAKIKESSDLTRETNRNINDILQSSDPVDKRLIELYAKRIHQRSFESEKKESLD